MLRLNNLFCLGLLWPVLAGAQQTPEINQILARLDKLETENRALAEQVQQLSSALAASRPEASGNAASGNGASGNGASANAAASAAPANAASGNAAADATASPSVDERLAIQESRVEEQAQTKVEASEKFPISLTGMVLFNTYLNSRQGGGGEYPTAAALTSGPEAAGATLRQTVIGLVYHGPQTFLGGTVHGSIYMDFFTGGVNFNSTLRLRTGAISLDWKTRNVMVGIDKPIFNPREPASLAQVGVSPLTGAGNLWLWLPQARVEQDFAFNASTGVRAVTGVVETHEASPYNTSPTPVAVASARPGIEGRYEFYHKFDDDRRFEIATGFHASETHAGGFSIPSEVLSFDWLFKPDKRVDLTGVFFTGQNVANLGTGSINEGYAVYRNSALAIAGRGAWSQFTVHTTRRLDLHLFSGLQYYESAVLGGGDVSRNIQYGANIFYHIAPNVIIGPEISQFRTLYLVNGIRLTNHYDLALAYLF
jgi:hypothetical protein